MDAIVLQLKNEEITMRKLTYLGFRKILNGKDRSERRILLAAAPPDCHEDCQQEV